MSRESETVVLRDPCPGAHSWVMRRRVGAPRQDWTSSAQPTVGTILARQGVHFGKSGYAGARVFARLERGSRERPRLPPRSHPAQPGSTSPTAAPPPGPAGSRPLPAAAPHLPGAGPRPNQRLSARQRLPCSPLPRCQSVWRLPMGCGAGSQGGRRRQAMSLAPAHLPPLSLSEVSD